MRTIAGTLLDDLRSRGAELRPEGDHLVVDAPRGVLTDDDRQALSATKALLLERLALESRLLEMSLEEFEKEGCPIEVRVPCLEETLWWVPRIEHVADLVEHNVARGRVYTAKELTNLTKVLSSGSGGADLRGIAALKLAFNATIVAAGDEVNDLPPEPESGRPPGACPACRERRFWRSVYGVVVCGVCHPPAAPHLVAEWLVGPAGQEAGL